jgi:YHS domain-containing protein
MPSSSQRAARFEVQPLLFALFAVALIAFAGAARADVYSEDGVALGGTDPVAYFTEGKPVQGSPEHSYDHDGATWHFASAGNRDAFAADPDKYAPKYGGYCAYAAAQDALAPTVPEAWSIVDGKLYLNYSLGVRDRWDADRANYISRADANWPGLDR